MNKQVIVNTTKARKQIKILVGLVKFEKSF
jgi:hypothetical protein